MRKLLAVALLLVASQAWGATYYVKATGNDSLNGLSQDNAWLTVAKVNGISFNAGDSVLFNRGDTWRERIDVSGTGAAGNVFTVGAYGTGAAPIISGADVVSGFLVAGGTADNVLRQSLGSTNNDYNAVGTGTFKYMASSFTANSDYALTHIELKMGTLTGTPWSVQQQPVGLNIYNDNGSNAPGTLLASSTTTRTDTLSGTVYYGWEFDGTDNLVNGTRYWVSPAVAAADDGTAATVVGQTGLSESMYYSGNGTDWTQKQASIQGTMKIYGSTTGTAPDNTIFSAAIGYAPTAVYIDNVLMSPARWPKTGYATITETATDLVHLHSTALTQADDYWIGANAVIRTNLFTIQTRAITASDNTTHTITWSGNLADNATLNYGFFIEGKYEELTADWEWAYDGGWLYIKLPVGADPDDYVIEAVGSRDEAVVNTNDYVTVRDLNLQGGGLYAVYSLSASNFTLDNCQVSKSTSGPFVWTNESKHTTTITNNTISNIIQDWGVEVSGPDYFTISNNVLTDIGSDNLVKRNAVGILVFNSDHGVIDNNIVTNISENGISVEYSSNPVDNVVISNNAVTCAMKLMLDGGGIYINGGATDRTIGGTIKYNRVIGCLPATDGVPAGEIEPDNIIGIYLDDDTDHVNVYYNVVSGLVGGSGIFLHTNGTLDNVWNNTVDNSTYGIWISNEPIDNTTTIKNNILRVVSGGHNIHYTHLSGFDANIGDFDYNLYSSSGTVTFYKGYADPTEYTFADWKTLMGKDASSVSGNPLFISSSDLRLQNGSPAINAGVSVGLSSDYTGAALNGLPDIGAYETFYSILTPSAPRGLSTFPGMR